MKAALDSMVASGVGSSRAMLGTLDRSVGLSAERQVAFQREATAPMGAGTAVLLFRSQV